MKNLVEIERLIQTLAESKDLATGLSSLRSAMELHEAKAHALKDEASRLASEASREQDAAEVLRVALRVLGETGKSAPHANATTTTLPLDLRRTPTWMCAQAVLRETKRPMTAPELADEISKRGKTLGKQATANVINSLKRYADKQELFYRESTEKGFVYGLLEWKKEGKKNEGSAPGLEV